ncbi:DUF423 domain-containing protein [Hyphomicrobium sp.]|jgi:uncharacterized membrane protein YgdD (TMEM256/DUF423 family)|uniref:DUF423 domain-containing protein n=1 Tax=Hyphomicrobium sp. TaxID=82 RepID=UPI002D0B88A2|nr:DUF423 domain-containing protein [Hyphomicrobium sp.]HVZ05399.1 DUF423 domain-containing protein [Hyphomicrobium sp.]
MSDLGETNRGALCGAPFLILAWAGLAGAAGVSLAAMAAHKVDSPALATAATMLTLHAAAAVGLIAVALRASRPCLWSAVAALMLAAASLFSGEIAFHTLTGNASFQMLAPVGGTLMIASWIFAAGLALAGAFGKR